MDAHSVIRRAPATGAASSVATALLRIVTAALLGLVGLAACVVWLRRASGALAEPLAPAALLAAAIFLCLAAAAFRKAHPVVESRGRRLTRYIPWALTTLVTLWAAAAITFDDTDPTAVAALWALVTAEEALAWGPPVRRRLRPTAGVRGLSQVLPESASGPVSMALGPHLLDDATGRDNEPISQHLVRRREDDGSETIEGWLRVDFAAGQRHATAHVAICPPLRGVPQCFAEISHGPSGEVKAAQVLCYGVRFEIKLDEPAEEPTNAVIDFSMLEGAFEKE